MIADMLSKKINLIVTELFRKLIISIVFITHSYFAKFYTLFHY